MTYILFVLLVSLSCSDLQEAQKERQQRTRIELSEKEIGRFPKTDAKVPGEHLDARAMITSSYRGSHQVANIITNNGPLVSYSQFYICKTAEPEVCKPTPERPGIFSLGRHTYPAAFSGLNTLFIRSCTRYPERNDQACGPYRSVEFEQSENTDISLKNLLEQEYALDQSIREKCYRLLESMNHHLDNLEGEKVGADQAMANMVNMGTDVACEMIYQETEAVANGDSRVIKEKNGLKTYLGYGAVLLGVGVLGYAIAHVYKKMKKQTVEIDAFNHDLAKEKVKSQLIQRQLADGELDPEVKRQKLLELEHSQKKQAMVEELITEKQKQISIIQQKQSIDNSDESLGEVVEAQSTAQINRLIGEHLKVALERLETAKVRLVAAEAHVGELSEKQAFIEKDLESKKANIEVLTEKKSQQLLAVFGNQFKMGAVVKSKKVEQAAFDSLAGENKELAAKVLRQGQLKRSNLVTPLSAAHKMELERLDVDLAQSSGDQAKKVAALKSQELKVFQKKEEIAKTALSQFFAKKRMKKYRVEIDKLDLELIDIETQLNSVDEELKRAEAELDAARTEVDAAQSEVDVLEKAEQQKKLAAKKRTLQAHRAKLQADSGSLKIKIDDMDLDIATKQKAVLDLQKPKVKKVDAAKVGTPSLGYFSAKEAGNIADSLNSGAISKAATLKGVSGFNMPKGGLDSKALRLEGSSTPELAMEPALKGSTFSPQLESSQNELLNLQRQKQQVSDAILKHIHAFQ